MSEITATAPPELDRFRQKALIVGLVGLVACIVGLAIDRQQFFRSYLLAFIFWAGVALGCFAILMVQHLSGGAWGLVIRRVLEGATRTFPLLLLLFLPLVFGMTRLYVWARPEAAQSPLLEHKAAYLNVTFFIIRAAFYFVVWLAVSFFLNRWSLEQDSTREEGITRRMQNMSGPGLVLYGLTVTFASIDWVMSLEPEWFSTIFGMLFMAGQAISAMSFVIATVVLLASIKPMSDYVAPRHLHDLGKLLLAFIMIWAYFSFSQFLIIYSGNLPEEITWYVHRLRGPWRYVGLGLVIFHFALPFLLLLSRDLKRSGRWLATLAVVVLVMRLVDLYWLMAPDFHEGSFHLHWMDVALPLGLGGVWLWFFAWQLKS
ncbi:MAG: hypothetical protein AB1631_21550, partial [Acidobacteriota bacterium]